MLPMSSASKNLQITTPRGDVWPKKAHIGPRALCCCAARPGRAAPKSWLRGPLAVLREGRPPLGARSARKVSNSANRMSSEQAGSVWHAALVAIHTTRVREPVPNPLQDRLSTHRLRPSRGAPSIMSMSPEPEEESAQRPAPPPRASRDRSARRERPCAPTEPSRRNPRLRPQREKPLRPRRDGAQPERRRRLPELPDALRRRGRGRRRREHLCGNQPVRRVHPTILH